MKIKAIHQDITINRDKNGIPHVYAESHEDIQFGLGYCHGMDRALQIILMRILGKGSASEHLNASDDFLEMDIFFRKINLYVHINEEIDKLSPEEKNLVAAYTKGINAAFAKKTPWELKLIRYKVPEWTIADTIMMSRLVSYITLAQTQNEIERFAILMIQAGASETMLREFFPGKMLDELDLDLIRKIKMEETKIPEGIRFSGMLTATPASNNWVISGNRTASGKPIMANDPHLEINRLPSVWYEIFLQWKDRYVTGASMPGIMGVIIGRNNDVSWGATYTYTDAQDYWIEHCKDGMFKKEGQWFPFRQRREVIQRKGKAPFEKIFYENDHGVLDGNPDGEIYRLTTQWASAFSGAKSLAMVIRMFEVDNAADMMDYLGNLESSWSWAIADNKGNIGYQMSGLLPRRREGFSGFLPVPGWDAANDWQGFLDHTELPRSYNPEQGFFVTANNFLNEYGKAEVINVAMGDYRADRIAALIKAKGKNITVEDCKQWQYDLFSPEAKNFMEIILPLLPDSPKAAVLKSWDCCYDNGSKGAYLFERILHHVYKIVFGTHGFGMDAFKYLDEETPMFVAFYKNFNDILYREESVWYKDKSRTTIFQLAIDMALDEDLPEQGIQKQIILKNIFFDGRLPRFLGFDKGPVPIPGSRGTINQSQIFKAEGRVSSFGPSFRIVADMAEAGIHTNLIGGPSDRRFSKWYATDIDNYVKGIYKFLTPQK